MLDANKRQTQKKNADSQGIRQEKKGIAGSLSLEMQDMEVEHVLATNSVVLCAKRCWNK